MSENITVISLDYDNSFQSIDVTKHDGYVEYDEGVASISHHVVFPIAPAIRIEKIHTLKNIATPPPYLGDVAKGVVIHRNAFMPMQHPHVHATDHLTLQERARREARVLKEVNRQTAFKEAASGKNNQTMHNAFLIMAIALSAATVITVVSIAAINFWPKAGGM